MKKDNNDIRKTLQIFEDMKRVFRLTEDDESFLQSNLKWTTFKKGHTIDGQNEILQHLIYLHQGAARTFYIANGREHNLGFTFASQFIVRPHRIMENGEYRIFVQFLAETDVCYISLPVIKSLTEHAAGEVYKFMNFGLINHVERLEEQMFMLHMDARSRYEWVAEKYPQLLELVSITQLASFLNVTKETLYRIRSGKY